ncbi:DUF2147 domain-containing protein [Afipia sp. TerB]
MRKIACSGLFLLAALGSAQAAEPIGEWQVEEKVATIKIVDCDGALWGVVASEVRAGGTDSKNPDKAKRGRPTLGMPVLLNMTKSTEEKNRWDGKIYNAKDGETYKASITLKSPNSLRVEGCYVWPLCGGQTWTRVPETAPAVTATAPKSPPKTVGSKVPPRKSSGAPAAAASEPVSEVCSLPEVTGTTH